MPTSNPSSAVTVVHTADVPPRPVPNGLRVAPMLGEQTGFDPLAQAVLECPPGTRTQQIGRAHV